MVKVPGGVMVRVIEALNGFKTKHAHWPVRLEIEARTLSALATYHLTPLGFFVLQSKIELAEGVDGKLVAFGMNGESFDYGEEGWQAEGRHSHDARAWLGITDDGE
jgi:hypothetical protein